MNKTEGSGARGQREKISNGNKFTKIQNRKSGPRGLAAAPGSIFQYISYFFELYYRVI